jgi:predicted nucleic acid-binding protein
VIDEKFGRDLCEFLTQKMGLRLRFTGTIGILKKMKKSGILSKRDLACIKSGIRNSRFYCKRELLNELDLPE